MRRWILLAALAAMAARAEIVTNMPAVARQEYLVGLTLLRENNFASAAEAFHRATLVDTNFAEAHQQWGVALLQMGRLSGTPQLQGQRLQEAAARFGKAAELQPKDRATWLLWSDTLVFIGDLPIESAMRLACYQGAVEKCRKAVELTPAHWEAYSKWAGVLTAKLPEFAVSEAARVQLHLEAAALYSNAVERADFKGDIGTACANRGAALVRAARASASAEQKKQLLRDALEQFQRSSKAVPNSPVTHTMCGSAFVQFGKLTGVRNDFREAVNQFNISLAIKPDDPAALYALACAHALMDNPIMAVESLKKSFAADPLGVYRKLALQDTDLASLHGEIAFQDLYNAPGTGRTLGPGHPPLRNTPR
jgi:tetratricopeptide (TPR) repeat protein